MYFHAKNLAWVRDYCTHGISTALRLSFGLTVQSDMILAGDRSFSRWKGSVVDSVVGAFLTQNVSDVLSR
jgi:hypothetical protein